MYQFKVNEKNRKRYKRRSKFLFFAFYQGFFFTDTDDSQVSTDREGTIFLFLFTSSTPAYEHPDTYLQLCM